MAQSWRMRRVIAMAATMACCQLIAVSFPSWLKGSGLSRIQSTAPPAFGSEAGLRTNAPSMGDFATLLPDPYGSVAFLPVAHRY